MDPSNASPSLGSGSGGFQEAEERDTMNRAKLNLQFGNITGIPSALGMTEGGGTSQFKFKEANSGGMDPQ